MYARIISSAYNHLLATVCSRSACCCKQVSYLWFSEVAELLPFAFTKDGNADVVLSWVHILTAGLHCANSML